ncbi:hypothetical protein BDZ45DRAFT_755159 [Acephala macrosclerotiorum]|nr:hypothetical protein BDZ45DRAFT_755159 [Acephala macrosclerotiorum]
MSTLNRSSMRYDQQILPMDQLGLHIPTESGSESPYPSPRSWKEAILAARHGQKSRLKPRERQLFLGNSIRTFIPYLHFETNLRLIEMQEAIRHRTHDHLLLSRYLRSQPTPLLHIRRTLDQSFYHDIETSSRDRDQVVSRYQPQYHQSKKPIDDVKLVMVDQFWMWVLGEDLVITAFPQRWQQPNDDPLNILEWIIGSFN